MGTVVDWQAVPKAGNGSAGKVLRVTVGLLLGQTNAMPRDLRAKFAQLDDLTPQADGLIVGWWPSKEKSCTRP